MTTCCAESWCQSVVVIYVEKQCLAGLETLAQPPACRMDTRETPAAKAAAPQRVPGAICALAALKTFLTQEENVLACIAYFNPKQRGHMGSNQLLFKRLSTMYINLQMKYRTQINVRKKEIKYKLEVEDFLINPSYDQIQE